MRFEWNSAGQLWFRLLSFLYNHGQRVLPRGIPCRERLGVTLFMPDARNNLFVHGARNLPYKFLVAEWLWIWFGHEDVETIARYNPNISKFSDDGITFYGAYGPRIRDQWAYVLNNLSSDKDSRQAIIQIWRPNPPKTKDVPCTLTAQYLIRNDKLHAIYSMRSSDVWLGLPPDIFNFTMLQNILSAQLGIEMGSFTIHLGSSHLYESNLEGAETVLSCGYPIDLQSPQLQEAPPLWLETTLRGGAGSSTALQPWETYVKVLTSKTHKEALEHLRLL